MKMADVAAFDNLEELAEMAEGLTTFVRQAATQATAAHVAEILRMQGDGDVGETIEMTDGETLRRLEHHARSAHWAVPCAQHH